MRDFINYAEIENNYLEAIKGIELAEIRTNYRKFMQISEVLVPDRITLNYHEIVIGKGRNYHIDYSKLSDFRIFRKYYRYFYRRYGWLTITFKSEKYFYFSAIKPLFKNPLFQTDYIYAYRTHYLNVKSQINYRLLKNICEKYELEPFLFISFNNLSNLQINKSTINEDLETIIINEYNKRAKKNKININPAG